ncbi:MAG: 4,5-DOPA dioxygenase extradiol [Bacteroidota bacterium]|jgi:4,5-DOPA dioxygenase extradiol
MTDLGDLKKISEHLPIRDEKMPVVFVGHGSPMNGIEDNEFSLRWKEMGKQFPLPAAVLCISAHWYTRGTFITAMNKPATIHDFYGFPQGLSNVLYPAPGDPKLARETSGLITKATVGLDHEWGLDHGCWSVVRHMYPDAAVPVLQLSIDGTRSPQWHYELASELQILRSKGVLILGSGNMVHNLRMLDWQNPDNGFDWAIEMNTTFKRLIEHAEYEKLFNYPNLGNAAKLSVPTPDHYLPLVYVLGLKGKNEAPIFFNDKIVMGSVSMTSVRF